MFFLKGKVLGRLGYWNKHRSGASNRDGRVCLANLLATGITRKRWPQLHSLNIMWRMGNAHFRWIGSWSENVFSLMTMFIIFRLNVHSLDQSFPLFQVWWHINWTFKSKCRMLGCWPFALSIFCPISIEMENCVSYIFSKLIAREAYSVGWEFS